MVRVTVARIIASGKESSHSIAESIEIEQKINYYHTYILRLLDKGLGSKLLPPVITWLETHYDPSFRLSLREIAVFDRIGHGLTDFFGNTPSEDRPGLLNEESLERLAGVYVCAPAQNVETYVPTSCIRDMMALKAEDGKPVTQPYPKARQLLFLRATATGYFHVREIPFAQLFKPGVVSRGWDLAYEGVGVLSRDYIRLILRDTLAGTSKFHNVYVGLKSTNKDSRGRFNVEIVSREKKLIREAWNKFTQADVEHMEAEFSEEIKSRLSLFGWSQHEINPVRFHGLGGTPVAYETVYRRIPKDFVKHKSLHFTAPDAISDLIEDIISENLLEDAAL